MNIETPYIWKNGEFINWDEAIDHNVSHALHYGTGAFEGIRFYDTEAGPKIFRLKEHIERLFYSASILSMEVDYSIEDIMKANIELVAKSGEKSGYIRPIMYYGGGKMGLYPIGAKIETVISVWKWGKYLADKAIDVKVADIKRMDPRTADMNAKISGGYYNNVLVSLQIHKEGFDEGLLLSTDGNIAEGPGENVFFVKGDQVYTPELGTILPGITRNTIIQLCKDKLDIEVIEEKISPDRLGDFDEAFFVGTAAEVTPIGSIMYKNYKNIYKSDEKSSITKRLEKLYFDVVTGKDTDYAGWLS